MTRNFLPKAVLTLLFFTAALSISFTHKPMVKEYTLKDAIVSKAIQFQIKSNGKYSGLSLVGNVKNNLKSTIKLSIPAGTLYHPEDSGEQTLIQLEDIYLTLSPSASKQISLDAFCTEASDRCPSEGKTMTIGENKNASLNSLIGYIKGKDINKSAYQDGVWAVSDHKSVSNIVAENKATKEFRTFVASLTGQKDTWFTSPQEIQLDEQGNFNYETVNVSGRISFDCSAGDRVRQDIYSSNGEPVFVSQKYMTARTNHVNYTFNLKVRGWEKGAYYIRIHNGNDELAKYEFSI